MGETLKSHYGPEIPRRIAEMIGAVHPRFNARAFIADALAGYEELELTARGKHMAHALRRHLPEAYEDAIRILMASLGPRLDEQELKGLGPFIYLPHVVFVAEYGLDHFELSMQAQYELTQRFSAEFSIRAYLERHPERTLAQLEKWTRDPSAHVRRLVSEGTRPRLPWAPRLRAFQKDPSDVLRLLELLRDDAELYVRRSVANNLNDIGKDHPELLVQICGRWQKGASPERLWVINHALRSAIKRGDRGALALVGAGRKARIALSNVKVTPGRARIGGSVALEFDLRSTASRIQSVLVDFRVHFVKAGGGTSPRVFKLKKLELPARGVVHMRKSVSLRDMTTRKHYPGIHKVEVVVNGATIPVGKFRLLAR